MNTIVPHEGSSAIRARTVTIERAWPSLNVPQALLYMVNESKKKMEEIIVCSENPIENKELVGVAVALCVLMKVVA